MTGEVDPERTDDAAQAANWVVRITASDADLDDFARFEEWLRASPERAAAYDRALTTWFAVSQGGTAAPRRARGWRRHVVQPRRTRLAFGGAAAAAASLGLVVLIGLRPAQTYVTAPRQHAHVVLDDGSRLTLNGATRLAVRFSSEQREVTLAGGEAAFDVAHDAARPFVVRIGARRVRVLGTEFDVKARGRALTVAVRRGVVQVRAAEGDPAFSLIAGDELSFADAGAAPQRRRIDPDDAFAWRADRLIYRDAPLSRVVEAVNARFGAPAIRIDDAAGRLPFSGVMILDDRDDVVRRLTLTEPVSARRTPSGISLSMDQKPTP